MRRTGTLLVLAALGGAAAAPTPDEGELPRLREDARAALRPTCGRCHDGALPTARPSALRVFDLARADWSSSLSDVQMDHMVGRFEGFKMPVADRATVQRFLDAERTRRALRSSPPPTDVPAR